MLSDYFSFTKPLQMPVLHVPCQQLFGRLVSVAVKFSFIRSGPVTKANAWECTQKQKK